MGNGPKRKKIKDTTVVERLRENNGALQNSLMNMRQMYDQKVMEVQDLTTQLKQRDVLITIFAAERGGLEVRDDVVDEIQEDFQGYRVERAEKDGTTLIWAIPFEDDDDS